MYPRVVVVGGSNTDLVVQTPRIPFPGETVVGGGLSRVSGGKGANQAVAAARLGAEVTFIARVGEDDFGATAHANLAAESIDTRFVLTTPGVASGVALIAVHSETGENSILVSPGANALLTPADIDAASAAFNGAQILVLSLEVPIETVVHAAALAARFAIPVVLNPAPARSLPPELLARVTILTPNETEARQLCGLNLEDTTPVADLARQLRQRISGDVIVTMGAAGALTASVDGVATVVAFPVQAVDTVAAGDCFTAALAVEVCRGQPLAAAVRFANAAAAVKVTRHGAQSGLPTKAEVDAFLNAPFA